MNNVINKLFNNKLFIALVIIVLLPCIMLFGLIMCIILLITFPFWIIMMPFIMNKLINKFSSFVDKMADEYDKLINDK